MIRWQEKLQSWSKRGVKSEKSYPLYKAVTARPEVEGIRKTLRRDSLLKYPVDGNQRMSNIIRVVLLYE